MFVKKISLKSDRAKNELMHSLQTTGFAILCDHDISKAKIESTYSVWQDFFADDTKHDHLFDPENHDGYFPFKSENAKGQSIPDLKEFYHYYKNKRVPMACKNNSSELREQLVTLAGKLLSWIDESLPQDIQKNLSQPLPKMIENSELTLLRILHYPPMNQTQNTENAVRSAAHEDINLITLLPAASAPGLQVKDRAGNWHDVSVDPGMIVMNVGDMLQEATNGYLPSTTHQVVNPNNTAESRYSMPLFLHARPDVRLSSRHTAGTYLQERLKEIGLK